MDRRTKGGRCRRFRGRPEHEPTGSEPKLPGHWVYSLEPFQKDFHHLWYKNSQPHHNRTHTPTLEWVTIPGPTLYSVSYSLQDSVFTPGMDSPTLVGSLPKPPLRTHLCLGPTTQGPPASPGTPCPSGTGAVTTVNPTVRGLFKSDRYR